jgi:hypothetical protein
VGIGDREEESMKKPFRPTIDHSLLSPSGRVSKRAREEAMKREAEILFPPGYWAAPEKTTEGIAQENIDRLLRAAHNLRGLAARGMSPKKHLKAAEEMEAEADLIRRRG